MSEVDSTANTPLPAPPSKRRRVHDEGTDTPTRYGTSEKKGDDAHTLHVSIREKTIEPRSESHSRSRSRSRSRTRRRDTDYYSSDRSPSSSRSRSRSRSRSDSRSASRSRSQSRSDSRTPSRSSRSARGTPLHHTARDHDHDAPTPPARQPARPHYVPRLALIGHTKPVSQARVSPDGRWIASASADGTIRIWDAGTGQHMDTLVGHMAGVSAVAWSPDSKTLASGSDDKAIRLWDRVTGRPTRAKPLLGHHNYVYCLAFSPKGNILASGSYDEAVFLWDVRAGRLMRSLPAHSDPVSGIDFCRDGTLVVSCSTDGLTRIWDTATGQCLRTLVHEDNPPITSVCFAPNGRYVLASSLDSCLRLWDYVSGTVKKTYQGHANTRFSVGACFGTVGDAAFVAAPSEDGDVVLWDVKSKEVVQRIRGCHDGVCFWVDVCGDTMVSAGQDCTIKVYRHQPRGGGEAGAEKNGNGKINGVKAGASNKFLLSAEAEDATSGSESPLKEEDVKKEE